VVCSLHGNRENSRQAPAAGPSSFERFADEFQRMILALDFQEDALLATVEIDSAGAGVR
jgi:hypothetical protein